MTPSNHSDEAIAAYPGHVDVIDRDTECGVCRETLAKRTAFDKGLAAAHAKQHAATREALAKALAMRQVAWGKRTIYLRMEEAYTIADALLALTGPLLDAGEVAASTLDGFENWVTNQHATITGRDEAFNMLSHFRAEQGLNRTEKP